MFVDAYEEGDHGIDSAAFDDSFLKEMIKLVFAMAN
jgi:hypothetical protein